MLNTELNLLDPDAFYQSLIDMHRGLTVEQSTLVKAKLFLLLANHVGDETVLRDAIANATDGIKSTCEIDTLESKMLRKTDCHRS